MTTSYDMFETHGHGPRRRRNRPDRNMVRVAEDIVLDAMPTVCEDSVLMAEVGAASMCIGYYVDEYYGDATHEFGNAPPLAALRVLEEFGPYTSVRPFALALCAGALARISADPEVHERADRIIRSHGGKQGHMDLWPDWRVLPLVTPVDAWVARGDDDASPMIITAWRDANARPHVFATAGYNRDFLGDEVGSAIKDIILGEDPEELLTMLGSPIDELPGLEIEQVTLAEAHQLLSDGIADIALAARRMLPRDLPMTTLAFLEHRRDVLAMSVDALPEAAGDLRV